MSGGMLYVGGFRLLAPRGTTVNNIAQWNGTSWSGLGSGLSASSLLKNSWKV